MRLGPTFTTDDRGTFAVLRDPGGAVVAVAAPSQGGAAPVLPVAWSVLNTSKVATARTNYGELFGWDIADVATDGPHGAYHVFSYGGEMPAPVGAFADIAARPGVHAHWLHFFSTDTLNNAVTFTREAGGTVLDVSPGPSGARMVVCEDPQGAAFGLVQRPA